MRLPKIALIHRCTHVMTLVKGPASHLIALIKRMNVEWPSFTVTVFCAPHIHSLLGSLSLLFTTYFICILLNIHHLLLEVRVGDVDARDSDFTFHEAETVKSEFEYKGTCTIDFHFCLFWVYFSCALGV
jgi:hypothetical protein